MSDIFLFIICLILAWMTVAANSRKIQIVTFLFFYWMSEICFHNEFIAMNHGLQFNEYLP